MVDGCLMLNGFHMQASAVEADSVAGKGRLRRASVPAAVGGPPARPPPLGLHPFMHVIISIYLYHHLFIRILPEAPHETVRPGSTALVLKGRLDPSKLVLSDGMMG